MKIIYGWAMLSQACVWLLLWEDGWLDCLRITESAETLFPQCQNCLNRTNSVKMLTCLIECLMLCTIFFSLSGFV